jgi:hypothetical protein
MKGGIFVIAEVKGRAAKRIRSIQKRFDPRLLNEWAPHVTLAGSSGMGPINPQTPTEELRQRLERWTPPPPEAVHPELRRKQELLCELRGWLDELAAEIAPDQHW